MRRIRSACCACAASGHAAAAPPRTAMKSRRLMSTSRLGGDIVPLERCFDRG